MWTFSRRSAFWHCQRSAIYQQKLHSYHSRRIRHRSFKEKKSHKLSPPWEGPFIIIKALLNGSYYLVDNRELKDRRNGDHKHKRRGLDDDYLELDRPWNIAQL